jgi:hypothetical protein
MFFISEEDKEMDVPIGTAAGRAYDAFRAAVKGVAQIVNGNHRLSEIVGIYAAFRAAEETLFEAFKDKEEFVILAGVLLEQYELKLNDEKVGNENGDGNS